MKWYDELTDNEIHSRYVFERKKCFPDDFYDSINILAEKWRDGGKTRYKHFSDFIINEGFSVTGIPDFSRFISHEMMNTRHMHSFVELYPRRLYDVIGMDLNESYDIHYEDSHAPMFRNNECFYKPGRF